MFEEIWTKDIDMFEKKYDGSIAVKVGTDGTQRAGVLDLVFDYSHSIVTLTGCVGSGKSSFVNLVLHNVLSTYDPASVKVMPYDFRALEFPVLERHPFPHFTGLPMHGQTEGAWSSFLLDAAAYVTAHNYVALLVVLDSYEVLASTPTLKGQLQALLDAIEKAPDTYALLSTQSPTGCEDIIARSTRRLALRCSAETSNLVLGNPCAAYPPAPFGYVYYASDVSLNHDNIRCYRTPYVPSERFWDMERLTLMKRDGKTKLSSMTLQYQATVKCESSDCSREFITFYAPMVVALGKKTPHAVVPPDMFQTVWSTLQNRYSDLTIMTLNRDTQWNIVDSIQKRAVAIKMGQMETGWFMSANYTAYALMCEDPSSLDTMALDIILTAGGECNYHVISKKPMPQAYAHMVLDTIALAHRNVDELPFDSTRNGLVLKYADDLYPFGDTPVNIQVPPEAFKSSIEQLCAAYKELTCLPLSAETVDSILDRMQEQADWLQEQGCTRYAYHTAKHMGRTLLICEYPCNVPIEKLKQVFKRCRQVGFHCIFAHNQANEDMQRQVFVVQ